MGLIQPRFGVFSTTLGVVKETTFGVVKDAWLRSNDGWRRKRTTILGVVSTTLGVVKEHRFDVILTKILTW